MAKPELGTKRLCGSCGAKFYDLSKDPIVCPKCGTVFEIVVPVARGRAVIDDLITEHGSVEGYVLANGMTSESVASLRSSMLEDLPATGTT